MIQLDLFSGICCDYCKLDPGAAPKNPDLWWGFMDADTQQRVCHRCRENHYIIKAKNRGTLVTMEVPKAFKKMLKVYQITAMTYSEFPILLNHNAI